MQPLLQFVRRDVLYHDWRRLHFAIAARCTPAIALIILWGVRGHHAAAAVMCGGALTAGSGVFQRLIRSQIGPMLVATLGMGVSAFVGTLAGQHALPLAVTVGVWGFAAGLLPALGSSAQWAGQQCAITLLVASSFPGTLPHALVRGGLVMAGGALQILTIEALLRLRDVGAELKGFSQTKRDAASAWRGLRQSLAWRTPHFHFALRVSATLAAAVVTERVLGLPNGYWVGMTAVLLLRADFHDTWHRSASRVAGTIAGGGVALLVLQAGLPAWAAAAGIPAVAYFCFVLQQFSYAAYSLVLTFYIVLLLSFGGLHGQLVAHYRIEGTVLGAMFALLGHLHFWFTRRRGPFQVEEFGFGRLP